MKTIFAAATLICLTIFTNNGALAQEATLLGPGRISTGNELSSAISPDGKELYFARRGENGWTMMVSQRHENSWSEPVVASFSGRYPDADPHFTADGQRLYFLSVRPRKDQTEPMKEPDIWYVERQGEGWGEAINVESINLEKYGETFMSLTSDNTIYFASNRPHPDKKVNIFYATFVNGSFETPMPLDADFKIRGFPNPLISRNSEFLIFESDEYKGGMGGDDLYITFKTSKGWSEPVNLGRGVNSEYHEGAPAISPDGKYLLFTRMKRMEEKMISNIYRIAFKPLLREAQKSAGIL